MKRLFVNILIIFITIIGIVRADNAETPLYQELGLPIASSSLGKLEKPLSILVEAYQRARERDREAFMELFEETQCMDAQEVLIGLYGAWQDPPRMTYTVAGEYSIDGQGGDRKAYLVLPKSLDCIHVTGETWHGPFVLFAMKKEGVWKLIMSDMEPAVTQTLLHKARHHRVSRYPTEEKLSQKVDELNRACIETLEQRGAERDMIIAEKEIIEWKERGLAVNTWEDWRQVYNARLLTNKTSFSCLDPFEMDFTEPYSAWRSRLHAQAVGNIAILLKYADEVRPKRMQADSWYATSREGKNLLNFPALTWITPLLTAETTVEGIPYILFLARSQDPHKGAEGFVSFEIMVLRKAGDTYIVTDDMWSSIFTQLLDFAGPKGRQSSSTPYGLYPTWHEEWSKSALPKWFYTIE